MSPALNSFKKLQAPVKRYGIVINVVWLLTSVGVVTVGKGDSNISRKMG